MPNLARPAGPKRYPPGEGRMLAAGGARKGWVGQRGQDGKAVAFRPQPTLEVPMTWTTW